MADGGDVAPGSPPRGSRPGAGTADKRLLRGAQTRRTVLRAAADAASLDGLEAISFGGLAATTGDCLV
jgi:hypothetical protein